MFFEHGDKLIPLSWIKNCQTDNSGKTTTALEDGQILKSSGSYTRDRIAAMAMPTVPANPGYFKIPLPSSGETMDDDWPVVPIVAWRIVGELNLAEPVTPKMDEKMQRYGVLCPNGRIYSPSGGRSYKSLSEFLQNENSRNARRPPGPASKAKKRKARHETVMDISLQLDRDTANSMGLKRHS